MGTDRRISVAERIAWYCLLAIPVLVPLAVGHIFLTTGNPFTYDPWVVPKLAALGALVGIGVASLAVGWATDSIPVRNVPQKCLMLAFFLLAAVATVTALHPLTAMLGGSTQRAGMLAFMLAGGVFLLASQLIDDRRRMVALSRSVMAGGALVATIGLVQALGYDPVGVLIAELWMIGRGTSTIGNSDWAGTFLVVPVVISATLALVERSRAKRIVAAACFGLTALGLLITLTRGAWVAAIVGLAIVAVAFWHSRGRLSRPALWTLGTMVALVAVVIVAKRTDIAPRFADLAGGLDRATGGRFIIWKEALAVIARHPLLGVGPDSFRLGWFPVRSIASVRSGVAGVAEDPHDVVLLLAATLGIPAMLVAVGTLAASLTLGLKGAFPKDARPDRLVYSGWWAALVASCVALLFSLNTIVTMTSVALVLAVVMAPRTAPTGDSAAARWALSCLAIVFAIPSIVFPVMSLASEYWMAQAVTGHTIANSQNAIDAAPWNYLARNQNAFALSSSAIKALANKDTDARTLFERADWATAQLVTWDPYEHDSYLLRAKLLTDAGAYLGQATLKTAIDTADRGLAVQPNSVPLRMEKVDALSQLGRWPEIVSTLQDVWNADPAFPLSGTAYAEALIRSGRATEATPVLAKLRSWFPTDQKVMAEIARIEAIRPTGTTGTSTAP